MIDLFIIDNGDKNWTIRNYLHEWPDHAQEFDTATGYRYVQETQRGHTQDQSNEESQTVAALRHHLQGGRIG